MSIQEALVLDQCFFLPDPEPLENVDLTFILTNTEKAGQKGDGSMKLEAIKLTKRRMEILHHMGIDSVEKLLQTYPLRYEIIHPAPASQWQVNDFVAFEGKICRPATVYPGKNHQSRTVFYVMYDNQEIEIVLFNRPWTSQIKVGLDITVFGICQGKNRVTASSFNFKPIQDQEGMRAVYTLPKEMRQSEMRTIIDKALKAYENPDNFEELVPQRYRQKYKLLDTSRALRWIHQPRNENQLHQAIRTLKYEEFLCFQCALQASQHQVLSKEPKVFDDNQIQEAINTLPYKLTADQTGAIADILNDLHSDVQMYRMVQGDVGCGKTVVAAMAMKACVLSGMQAALLAPTEILARQHLENLSRFGLEARLLTSSLPKSEQKEIKSELADGSLLCIVGTHSLFQEGVEFENLGLVIADEQQRFGVRQRRALIEKGNQTDFLMMSATPIPRTYAHFLFGDISLSSIKTMPPNRHPVKTKFVPGLSMKPFLPEVLSGLDTGRQLYVVCPSIEDNPDTDMTSAKTIYEGMCRILSARYHIGLLHGKMKTEEKEVIMEAFKQKKLDILVSTTVVEVGVDVPDATMMVIYDAHRFGLSTLHQLRGRTARGPVQGNCWLLSNTKDPEARKRLEKLETLLDGFAISEYDLQTRGPGDLLGVRQSGLPAFILGDFEKDPAMMAAALKDAKEILSLQLTEDKAMLDYIRQAAETSSYLD